MIIDPLFSTLTGFFLNVFCLSHFPIWAVSDCRLCSSACSSRTFLCKQPGGISGESNPDLAESSNFCLKFTGMACSEFASRLQASRMFSEDLSAGSTSSGRAQTYRYRSNSSSCWLCSGNTGYNTAISLPVHWSQSSSVIYISITICMMMCR